MYNLFTYFFSVYILLLFTANPLQPGNVIINGDCKYCNIRGD
ncbi:hypothetical protein KR215_002739 [Drosophila sulfurigaster]|nr:hypothetical protein KR215_002739 [Drosophila sulfurigaster]